ncbi:MAG: ABC transporter ATP-binding protein [Bacteroidota bacterium]|nr:ABC transporter ATP-binding protein [Bacteroidota bacterium]
MLEIKNISKNYGDFALKDINLNVSKGEYFILLGRSGAGKSQLLEIIAGLRSPDRGTIYLNGRDITHEKIQKRKIGLVFQDFAIFPHMTVYDNIAYSLKIKRLPKVEIDNRVKKMAENVNIAHLLDRKTEDLSGGEKQRLALARTLVNSPELIMLDEPMASIDAPLRDDIRQLLRRINEAGITMLHVTHDYSEAVRLSHRVGVIHNGRILQTGDTDSVFSRPVNKFVARFAGIRNFYRVKIYREKGKNIAVSENCKYTLPAGDYPENGLLLIKSDSIHLSPVEQNNRDNCIRGKITELNRAESGYELFVNSGDLYHVLISSKKLEELSLKKGQLVFLCFSVSELRVI